MSFDTAEYLSHHLDGYEHNLNVLNSRLRESFQREERMLEILDSLIDIVCRQRVHCETQSFCSFLKEDQNTIGQLASVRVRSTGSGGSRLDVSQELLEALHTQIGFSWA